MSLMDWNNRLTQIQNTAKNVPEVLEEKQYVATRNMLCLACTSCSRDHKVLLFLAQPRCIFWEVDDKEKGHKSHENRKCSFKDEDPLPIVMAKNPIHLCDRRRKKTTKGRCQENRTPVNRESCLRLFAFVPDTDEIKA
jgi:hypothetical protein